MVAMPNLIFPVQVTSNTVSKHGIPFEDTDTTSKDTTITDTLRN